MSKVYNLSTVQFIPCSLDKAWEFFSNPANLAEITPDNLNFKILSKNLGAMYPGQVIEYKVHPLLGIPLYWMTEITHVQYHKYFVDEQRFGPYHQHHFKEVASGVEITDEVNYAIPLGLLGRCAHWLFVGKVSKGQNVAHQQNSWAPVHA